MTLRRDGSDRTRSDFEALSCGGLLCVASLLFSNGAVIDHIPNQSHGSEQFDRLPSDVEFPPLVTVLGHTWVSVVVVVPAFTVSHDRDQPVIAAIVGGFVVLVAPHVRCTVDHPSRMQNSDQADEHAPNQHRDAEFPTAESIADAEQGKRSNDVNWQEQHVKGSHRWVFVQVRNPTSQISVAVTVVRVESEPENVTPNSTVVRRVRITFEVTVCVVFSVVGDPIKRRSFSGKTANGSERVSHPVVSLHASVGQQAVIAEANPEAASDPVQHQSGDQSGPRECERCGQANDVSHRQPSDGPPTDVGCSDSVCFGWFCQIAFLGSLLSDQRRETVSVFGLWLIQTQLSAGLRQFQRRGFRYVGVGLVSVALALAWATVFLGFNNGRHQRTILVSWCVK
ncbi:hypothetical protein-transmembrane prediction [Rhodopirellula baltica SH 1]|uniref:Uncharacterized protein n=1 Tax=Rhodopirellula baltica (strain DSM 10527 / NCIMB 13988 / SH1) TaxID=243090 RepID=Q7UH32_RHOBA|nr:hypothetical protein-transmembrane prediction [Rhodopirellula baltica SH 1]